MFLVLIFVAFSTFRNVQNLSKSNLRIQEAQEKVEKLEMENKELARKKEMSEKVEFKESQIRDRLDMVKEGEIIVILPDAETVKKFATAKSSVEVERQIPNWQKWLNLFLNS